MNTARPKIDLARKFWAHIESNLQAVVTKNYQDQTMPMSFAGGSLCLVGEKSLYILRVNGEGSVNLKKGLFRSSRVIMPNYITKLVQRVYLEVKGVTPYFQEKAKTLDDVFA